MPEQLPNGAQKSLLILQKEVRKFLKGFASLDKKSPAYKKFRNKAIILRKLYVALGALELSAVAKEVVKRPTVSAEPEDASGTSKDGRKKRREVRKDARKADRAKKRADRAVAKITRKKQRGDKTGNKEEGAYRFEKIKAVWEAIKFDEITENFRAYLDEGEAFLNDARNYISFVENYLSGYFTEEAEQVQEFIKKLEKFLALARNVSREVDRYAKLAKDIVNVITSLPRKVEDLKDGVVEEAIRVFAAAKSFIATADTDDEETAANVVKLQKYLDKGQHKLSQLENLVGLVIEDKDKDNLPDWYNRLSEKYDSIFGKGVDLVPGTKIDDKILLEIQGLKKSVDEFVAKASDEVEKYAEQIKNAQQWLGQLSKFTEAITGFIDNVKDGDLEGIYEDVKEFYELIQSDKDLLNGTNIDDRLKAKLQEHSKKAQTWLMNKLTGGDPTKKDEVHKILGAIDNLITSTGGVVDHSSKYEKDEGHISIPDIKDVSQSQIDEVLKRHGIRDMDSSYEGVLSDMKDQADKTTVNAGAKFKESAKRGAQASVAFRDAKEEYDDAVKKHNDYFKATNLLGSKVIKGLLSIAGMTIDSFVPGAGTVIKAIGEALFGEFTAINKEINNIIPKELNFISDLAKDMIPVVLPQFASEKGLIEIQGKELLKGLNKLYSHSIAARYLEVIELLNRIKANASNLSKNLRSLEQASNIDTDKLAAVKKKVIILELKWKGLEKDIMNKYVNLAYPPINEKKAYHYASRYLYSVWLIRFPQKEIRIGNSLIDQFEKFGILADADVEWNTGFFSKLGRSIFGIFGADQGNHRDKVKALKSWANTENSRLKTAEAWAKVF